MATSASTVSCLPVSPENVLQLLLCPIQVLVLVAGRIGHAHFGVSYIWLGGVSGVPREDTYAHKMLKSLGQFMGPFSEKQQKITEIKAGLYEADMLIRKMDLEARSLQPNIKAMLLAKLREYKSDLNNLKREVKRISSPNHDQATREELLESGMADALKASANQRERLAFSTERLEQSSERLRESRRTVLETEELGVSILQDLHQQRETLLHSHVKLHDVDNAIDKSKKILTAMSRRISKNKWIFGSVIGVLLLAIIFIVYFKLTHH